MVLCVRKTDSLEQIKRRFSNWWDFLIIVLKVRSIWSRQSIETIVKECPGEKSLEILYYSKGFSGGTVVKNLPASVEDTGDMDSILGSRRYAGGRNGSTRQYSCLENSTDKRSLAGYSPSGSNESDMNEQMSTYYAKVTKHSERK